MSFEFTVALRYLNAKRKGLFSLLTTAIAIAGVSIGVATLVTAMAIITGFETNIKEKVLGGQSHIMIFGYMPSSVIQEKIESIEALPLVSAAAAHIYGQAIITKDGHSAGVMLRGFDPVKETRVSTLIQSIEQGSFNVPPGESAPPIVLGATLAATLEAKPGDNIVLISPRASNTGAGTMPKMKRFNLTGIIKTGYHDFDSNIAYTSLEAASDFMSLRGGANSIAIKLKDINALAPAKELIAPIAGAHSMRDYTQFNSTFYASLKLQKMGLFIILSLIILVAALNIASNLILLGKERLKEIGLLRAMGAKPAAIRKIFIWEGMMICTAGILCGLVLAGILCWIVSTFNIVNLPADMYFLSRVPVTIKFWDVASVVAGSYVLCFATALYPAFRGARINPIDAIRYG